MSHDPRVIVEIPCGEHRLSVGGCFCDDYVREVFEPPRDSPGGGHCPTPKKVIFGSRARAYEHIVELNPPDEPMPAKPYECQAGHWHITSTDLVLLREDRETRRWAVARKLDGTVVLSLRGKKGSTIGLSLSEPDRWELAKALFVAGVAQGDPR